MSAEILITVDRVAKKFCRSLKKSLWYGVQDIAGDVFGGKGESRQLRAEEFWAVDDVSFELRRGECLGLIGRNGAGKTTLLKMLNGLIKPDSGCITLQGRVGALIALGAGFNPILSGRENIYVNGSVLGLTRNEIKSRVDEIIDFAEIGEFINSPVQNYSSGMQVRLGFAIATALKPDVLILDEVLAVGDAAFRHKCYHRISKLLDNAAVILVSHSMDYIAQVCSSVVMMRRGSAEWYSEPLEGVNAYGKENESSGFAADGGRVEAVYPPIRSVRVHLPTKLIAYGGALSVEVELESDDAIEDLVLSFAAVNRGEQAVMEWNTRREKRRIRVHPGRQLVRFSISPLFLHPGRYTWNLTATRPGSIEHTIWLVRAGHFDVEAEFRPCGDIPYLPVGTSCEVVKLPLNAKAVPMAPKL